MGIGIWFYQPIIMIFICLHWFHDFRKPPYHPISSHIIPYHPISSHIIPYHPISSHIIPYHPILYIHLSHTFHGKLIPMGPVTMTSEVPNAAGTLRASGACEANGTGECWLVGQGHPVLKNDGVRPLGWLETQLIWENNIWKSIGMIIETQDEYGKMP